MVKPTQEQTKLKPKWYELDRLVKFRDPMLLIGFACVLVGIQHIYWPAAMIFGGLGLMALAWLMAEK